MSASIGSLALNNTAETKLVPAELGMWLFLIADMSIFALYFWVFLWEKSALPEQFVQGRETLNHVFGAMNTVNLLVSSYFMAKAVRAARRDPIENFSRYIKITMACGVTFLFVKGFEYSEKFDAGFHVATNEFYRYYFVFTGMHLLHVMIGLSLLLYLLLAIKTKEQAQHRSGLIEGNGLYWHMVDLLWIMLFSLIYLVP